MILQACVTLVPVLMITAIIFGMTSAWYTNVVKEAALTVRAGAWSFNSDGIQVTQGTIEAKPGDKGVLALSLTNSEDSSVDIRVDADKSSLTTAMQKRIYFFVETESGRVYLNSDHGYIYEGIEPGETLVLDDPETESAIQWEWVYDVLGYYVRGTVTPETENEGTSEERVVGVLSSDAEYLMPVKYDLDSATFDEDGNLKTTDGSQTAAEFLAELYAVYGASYEDSAAPVGNYYPIDVNDDGYGVWVYLGSWDDIQRETQTDTSLGQASDRMEFIANLVFSGQNSAG